MSYHVYILQSEKNSTYYKGYTSDLSRRCNEHSRGKDHATSRYRPWKLIWAVEKPSKSEAIVLERKIKNITSKARLELFMKKYPLDVEMLKSLGISP